MKRLAGLRNRNVDFFFLSKLDDTPRQQTLSYHEWLIGKTLFGLIILLMGLEALNSDNFDKHSLITRVPFL